MTSRTRRGSPALTLSVLTVAVFAFSALQSLFVPVLPQIQQQYDVGQRGATWILTAYLLSASVCTPLLGRVGDIVGKRRVLLLALAALTLGSLLAALAPSFAVLVAARVVQGIGGGVMPLAFGIVRDEIAGHRVGRAIGILAALGSLGYGAGLVAAGPVVDHLGFHWLFWLPMIVTALAAAATLFVPESPRGAPSGLPYGPALLLALWLVLLLLALSQGNVWGWTSAEVLGLLAAALVIAALWALLETRVATPMIDLALMRRRGVWTSNLVATMLGFCMFAGYGFIPQLVQTPPEAGYGFGSTLTESGRMLLPSTFAMFAVGFATSWLVRTFGSRTATAAGCVIGALSFVALAALHDHPWQVTVFMTTLGAGLGTVFATLAGVVVEAVPPDQTGVASGMNANVRTIGGSLGAAVMAGLVTARHGTSGYPVESGYVAGLVVLAAALCLAAVAALWVPDSHHQATGGRLLDADNAELGLLPMSHTR
ncbi:MFS transporter [Nocardioides humi]|uniref:MFS transporter n=1 Tax=Nocardioides humi TaxID=449461 RepID=A0ABN2AGX3_9ACTN|nr:MFS transporter [Nocardioides humi]